ncbi:MAG: hypothetical protein LBC53_10470 [Spirochaetaceae bacterium]|nr:hypothetical protein [Spirochaetaceae bacterium]
MSENKAFDQVYDQIYSMLCYSPGGEDPGKTNKIIQLGVNKPINPDDYNGMAGSNTSNIDVQKTINFAMLVDQIPSVGNSGGSSGKTLNVVYKEILDGANVKTHHDEAQEKRYAEARKLLYDDTKEIPNPDLETDPTATPKTIFTATTTPLYQAYLNAKSEYDSATANYFAKYDSEAAKTIKGQGFIKKLQSKIDDAYNKLTINGRVDVERALAEMDTSKNDGLSMAITEAKQLISKTYLTNPTDQTKWNIDYSIPLPSTWCETSAADAADAAKDQYLQIVEPQRKNLEDAIAAAKTDLQKAQDAKNDKMIDSLNDKLDKLNDKLSDLNDKIQEKLGEIADKYADKIDAAPAPFYSDLKFEKYTYKEHNHASSSSYGGGVALSYGLFSIGVNADLTSSHKSADQETSNVIVRGKIATIQIVRPWFDPVIFSAGGWTNTMFDKNKISSGNPMDKDAVLPMYTTALIIAKDLSIESAFSTSHIDENTFSGNTGAQVGFGPFKFGPTYSHSESDFKCEKTSTGYKLTNKGVQIIGYINEIVPPCPCADDPGKGN